MALSALLVLEFGVDYSMLPLVLGASWVLATALVTNNRISKVQFYNTYLLKSSLRQFYLATVDIYLC